MKVSIRLVAVLVMACFQLYCVAVPEPEPDFSKHQVNPQQVLSDAVSIVDESIEVSYRVNILGEARDKNIVEQELKKVAAIYSQCNVKVNVELVNLPEQDTDNISARDRYELSWNHAPVRPTVFIVNTTAEQDVAYSYLPSLPRDISATAWVSNRVREQCLAWIVAHELGHILFDSAFHHSRSTNVMHASCRIIKGVKPSPALPEWTEQQCAELHRQLDKLQQ